jgi:RNA polymerase sigma factor (sigma-70 family)
MASPEDGDWLPPRGRPQFATTHWSLVLAAGGTDSLEARPAMERLLETYWYPLYAFVRGKGHAAEAAYDSTQEFISRLLERKLLHVADPTKGRFRTFLLTCLERFLVDEWAHANRQKRGGGRTILSLSAPEADERYRLEPADPLTPERIYEKQWAIALLERTLSRLKEEATAAGRGEMFEALAPFLSGDDSGSPYLELAARLGMKEGALRTAVHRLRKRYGALLRDEIASTVSDPKEVEEELRDLFLRLA